MGVKLPLHVSDSVDLCTGADEGSNTIMMPFCHRPQQRRARRAQGSSLECGCLYFDHSFPADRGYGYVGLSRFKTKAGVFLFGTVRRTDWPPIFKKDGQQLKRSAESQ